MTANYHTHTKRCKHASGEDRAYVEQAILAGLKTLGFTDHTPHPFPDDYVTSIRMPPNQAEEYFRSLSDLKREYAGQIDIRIGLEAEYYPKYFPWLMELLQGLPCEYLILGQHFTCSELDGVYAGSATKEEATLVQYVSQVLEGLDTGVFTYLAHPDLLRWEGCPEVYEREMRRLCSYAKVQGYPLEINLLGIQEGRRYPNEAFWKIAGEIGNPVVLGSDAHKPENVYRPDAVAAGTALANKYGLHILEAIDLRPVHS